MAERTYYVTGVHCNSCALNITDELETVSGVASIDVEVEAGRVTVRGDGFTDAQVAEAVRSAGYEMAP